MPPARRRYLRSGGPLRPWTAGDHADFEDELREELASMRADFHTDVEGLRADVRRLGDRVAWLLGILTATALVAGPLAASLVSNALGGK